MDPLGPPVPKQPLLLGRGVAPLGRRPGLGCGVVPPGHLPWPRVLPLALDTGWLLKAITLDLGLGVSPLGRRP